MITIDHFSSLVTGDAIDWAFLVLIECICAWSFSFSYCRGLQDGKIISTCCWLCNCIQNPHLYLLVDRISFKFKFKIDAAPLLACQSDKFQIQIQPRTSTCLHGNQLNIACWFATRFLEYWPRNEAFLLLVLTCDWLEGYPLVPRSRLQLTHLYLLAGQISF